MIAAETAARRGDDERAQALFSTALGRGVPLFSDGLSLTGSAVPRHVMDPDLTAPARRELHHRARSILTFARRPSSARWRRTWPSIRSGRRDAEAGWRRFVHAHLPEDPRDFWSAP